MTEPYEIDDGIPDQAEAEIPEAPTENVPVQWTTREAPEEEPEPDQAAADAPRRPTLTPGTTVRVVYRGGADVADLLGSDGKGQHTFRFRPGEPVEVPSEVAEELLTWPGEQFEIEE